MTRLALLLAVLAAVATRTTPSSVDPICVITAYVEGTNNDVLNLDTYNGNDTVCSDEYFFYTIFGDTGGNTIECDGSSCKIRFPDYPDDDDQQGGATCPDLIVPCQHDIVIKDPYDPKASYCIQPTGSLQCGDGSAYSGDRSLHSTGLGPAARSLRGSSLPQRATAGSMPFGKKAKKHNKRSTEGYGFIK